MRACELCGRSDPDLLLRSERLDGPLVRCPGCRLVYVGERRQDFTFAGGADPVRTEALGALVDRLGIVARDVEAAEGPQRRAVEHERAEHLRRFLPPGRHLLDVGSAQGGFVVAAAELGFDASGVEPDPGTSAAARACGLCVQTATLDSLQGGPFDAITMFHVIEHLDSPRAALHRVRALLGEGGVLVLETPTVENLWFRLAPGRWRQLIPDHYWFFSRATLERMLRETGFRPLEYRTIGRRVTLRFAADRLRRGGVPGASLVARAVSAAALAGREVELNPGDIMRVVARAA
jgi:SAM-dependent methyltransferase